MQLSVRLEEVEFTEECSLSMEGKDIVPSEDGTALLSGQSLARCPVCLHEKHLFAALNSSFSLFVSPVFRGRVSFPLDGLAGFFVWADSARPVSFV